MEKTRTNYLKHSVLIAAMVLMMTLFASVFALQGKAAAAPFSVTLTDGTAIDLVEEGTITDAFGDGQAPLYCATVPEGTTEVKVSMPQNWYAAPHDNWSQDLQGKMPVITEKEKCGWIIDNDTFAFYGLYFKTASSTEKATVDITLSAQQENTFLMPHKTLTVTEGLAEDYGFKNDSAKVSTGQVSTLDALVAAHIEVFGDTFTKENASEFLAVSDSGMITKMFATESSNCGFAVNGIAPNDGVLNPVYNSYTGYMVNQAVLQASDEVEFYFYGDTYSLDSYTWFTDGGKKASKLNAAAKKEMTLNIKGYPIAYAGMSPQEDIDKQTKNMEDAVIDVLDENGNPIDIEGVSNKATDEDGNVKVTFPQSGTYTLSLHAGENANTPMISPWCTVIVTTSATPEGAYIGTKTEAKVYDDWENDLWLQYEQKEMLVGDTATIYPWRLEQIVSDPINNDVKRPEFNFDIIAGDSITLDTLKSTEKAMVTAVKPGTSVVKVTYDALTYKGKTYGAISDVNIGYLVYTVGEEGTAKITNSISQSHYDTIYYTEGETTPYTFTATAEGAEKVTVTCNGIEIDKNGDSYTANLENRNNIIGITAADKDGKTKSVYKIVEARKVEINVVNTTNPENEFTAGDTAEISFKGITMPVYKLATIFNPTWYSASWGSNGTYVEYKNDTLGTVIGRCGQWDLSTKNTITTTFDKAGKYTFDGGRIYSMWWGDPLGSDTTKTGQGEPNLAADTHENYFCQLPEFSVEVAEGVDKELVEAKAAAAKVLDQYKNAADYREAQQAELAQAIADGKVAVEAAADKAGVEKAVAEAKAAMDSIKTDAQLTEAERIAARDNALSLMAEAQKDLTQAKVDAANAAIAALDSATQKEIETEKAAFDQAIKTAETERHSAALKDGTTVLAKGLTLDQRLVLEKPEDEQSLIDIALKDTQGRKAILALSAKIVDGEGNEIALDKPVTLTISCDLSAYDYDPEKIDVAHIKDGVLKERLLGSYDADAKTVTLTVESFSDFVITATEKAVTPEDPSKPDPGTGDNTGNAGTTGTTGSTSSNAGTGVEGSNVLPVVAGLLVLATAGFVVYRKKTTKE